MIVIEVHNGQAGLPVDAERLRQAVRGVLEDAALAEAHVSLAIVDDATIRGLHAQYLADDTPTDVLSFVLEASPSTLEGEVIASADTARTAALRYGWAAEDELLLYVIHGALHLVGYRDGTPAERARMRAREAACLARFGLEPHNRPQPAAPRPGARRRSSRAAGGKPPP